MLEGLKDQTAKSERKREAWRSKKGIGYWNLGLCVRHPVYVDECVYSVHIWKSACVFVVVCAHECMSISFMKGYVYVCVLIGATVHTPCSMCVCPKWALTVCSVRHTHNAALCADLRNVREHRAVGEKRAAGVDGGRVRKGRGMRRGEERWQEHGEAPGVCRVAGLLWIRWWGEWRLVGDPVSAAKHWPWLASGVRRPIRARRLSTRQAFLPNVRLFVHSLKARREWSRIKWIKSTTWHKDPETFTLQNVLNYVPR